MDGKDGTSGSRPRFDPARVSLRVGDEIFGPLALRTGIAAMRPGAGVDYFEAWDVVQAMVPECQRRKLNASYVADRLLQKARRGGYIVHRGRGQWVLAAQGMSAPGQAAERLEAQPASPVGGTPMRQGDTSDVQ